MQRPTPERYACWAFSVVESGGEGGGVDVDMFLDPLLWQMETLPGADSGAVVGMGYETAAGSIEGDIDWPSLEVMEGGEVGDRMDAMGIDGDKGDSRLQGLGDPATGGGDL
ncbi:hypothetical protein BGZ65_004753 [Modicella reniformis]|uniref:Uncharacterized protein n=1 Tax=Modicella reniformis TaxID=1440133 RepID=A0A9P6LST8_9FUNG|nr:hypothetical protein BGZ65_004753 [Modicella reniformis]